MIIAGNSNVSSFKQQGLVAAGQQERIEVCWVGALKIEDFSNGHPAGGKVRELFNNSDDWKLLSIGIHDIFALCRAAGEGRLPEALETTFRLYCRLFKEFNASGKFAWLVFPQAIHEMTFPNLTGQDVLSIARQFNGRVEAWCRGEKIAVINPLKHIIGPDGQPRPQFLQKDLTHLNVEAAKYYLEEIGKVTGVTLFFEAGSALFEPQNEPESFCSLLLSSLQIPFARGISAARLEEMLAVFVTDLLEKKGLELAVDPQTELIDSGLMDSLNLVETYTFAMNAIGMDLVFDVDLRSLNTIGKICSFLAARKEQEMPEPSSLSFADFLLSVRGDFDDPAQRGPILEAESRIAGMSDDQVNAFIGNFSVVAENMLCKYGVVYFWLALFAAARREADNALYLLTEAESPDRAFPFSAPHLAYYHKTWSEAAGKSATPQRKPVCCSKAGIFRESALAHKWLDGLTGLEVGPSAHNPFGLRTRNVGLRFDGYEREQLELAGTITPLDMVAPADDIPVADDSEDFLLASHVIEHCPDLIKTLVEWYRVAKPGGIIYMIVPFRDAAPTDKGRPLTEWGHVVGDFINGVTGATEPEANGIPFGFGHYHVFEINSMHGFMEKIFGNRLELVDHQVRDDKIGNGFTLVYRKARSFNESFPWYVGDGPRVAAIGRDGAPQLLRLPEKMVVAANLVPFKDEGQRQRQKACIAGIAGIASLADAGVVPLNICYPDELLEPAGWQTAPVLQRSADGELKIEGKRKPFVMDLFAIVSGWASERGMEWFALTNSDIIFTGALIAEVGELMAAGYETMAVSRNEVERIDPILGTIPGYLEINGSDIFICRTSWWQHNSWRFQPYVYGERAWDNAYAAIMACHSRFAMLYRDGLCFHMKHPTSWLTGPYADYNMGLYTGIDKPYSDRYEAFIREVIGTDKARLASGATEVLLRKYFPRSEMEETGGETQADTPFVNICIITYNRLEFTRQCFDALAKDPGYPHVITVIDNNSQDGTREYLRSLHADGCIKNLVLLEENVGVAKASNLAWSLEPDAPYYMKLDNDIVMQKKGWLGEMIPVIEAFPQIGALGYNFEPVIYPAQTVGGFTVRVKERGNLGGACILIPKRTEKLLGSWCEDYGLYGEEDADYGHRIIAAGLLNVYMADEDAGFHLPAGKAAAIESATWRAADGMEEKDHAAYRAWKDDQRRKNIENGLFLGNLNRYSTDSASLHQTSAFVEERRQNRQNRAENLLSPETDITSTPPLPRLKVLVFSFDLPESACARLRLLVPLRDRMEIVWAVSDATVNLVPLLEATDLVIIQRAFPCRKTEVFLNQILASGKPVIYETDDLLIDLPEGNPLKERADELAPFILDLLPKVAAVTVSTNAIREVLLPYNERIEVLPNMLDERLWGFTDKIGEGPVVIGYTGTPTHQADLGMIEEALCRIAEKYGESLSFVFMGCATERMMRLPRASTIDFTADYAAYARILQQSGIDIALVPLENNRFNRCKSNIKWLEYSACGIAGIYSDLPPYDCIKQGETGLKVHNTGDDWFNALDDLIRNPEKRKQIALNARREVMTGYTVAAQAHLYPDTLTRIVDAHGQNSRKLKFSIVIMTWNRATMLDQCLTSLFANLTDRDSCQVIVGNNGSTDATEEVLARYRIDKYVRKTEKIGLEFYRELFDLADGEYIIELDDDVIDLPKNFDSIFEEYFLSFPDYGFLGLDVVQNRFTNGAKPAESHYAEDTRGGITLQEGGVIGCCACIRRDTFDRIGRFNNAVLSMACVEDGVLGERVRHIGMRTGIIKDIKCFHACGPYYSKAYGYIDRDIEKYAMAGLNSFMTTYRKVKEEKKVGQLRTVSIIIPLFNKVEYTRQCLEGLVRSTSSLIDFDVILIDNASTDGTGDFLRTLSGNVTIITNLKNLGFARACNQGGRLATGEYLVFLNNDTIPKPGWLEALLDGIERDGADICGARLLYPNGKIQHAGVAFEEHGIGYHIFNNFDAHAPAVTRKRFMQCVTGACMIMRKELFHTLTGFDEGYTNGYEDVDLCLRAGAMGSKILYVPDSTLIHFEETSEGRKSHEEQNSRKFLARWGGKVRCDDNDYYRLEGFAKEILPGGRIRVSRMESVQPSPRNMELSTGSPAVQNVPESLSAGMLAEKGMALKREHRYGEALEVFSAASNRGDASVLAHVGDCLANLGKMDEAEAAYRGALNTREDDAVAHTGMGVVKLLAGQHSAAAISFSKALKSGPDNSRALCGLGMARTAQGRLLEGFELFKKSLHADPENLTTLHELLKSAYTLERLPEAEPFMQGYLMYHPADSNILFSLAGLRYRTGSYPEARDAIERLLALDPEYEGGFQLAELIAQAPAGKGIALAAGA